MEAIRALQYEGSPLENARSFKDQGNDMVKVKRWKDGQEFYSKAIGMLHKSKLERKGETDEYQSDSQKEEHLLAICYVNRSFCNLELGNYRSTTMDCAQTLRIDPKNVKACYRSSLALLALDKIIDAADACQRGLLIEPSNVPLVRLLSKIQARKDALQAAQQKRRQQADAEREARLKLMTALKDRNIKSRRTSTGPDLEDAVIRLESDLLHFPILLLYPLDAQSDFIKAVSESDTFMEHLKYVFPLPWDEKHSYSLDSIELYMETTNGLIKVGKKMSLLKILSGTDVEVVNDLVTVNVVPKAKASEWIAEMRTRHGK